MAEGRQNLVEECYRRAAETRRMADANGITPAEKADLLEVERRWLSLAEAYQAGD
jgi:hypothetical protein